MFHMQEIKLKLKSSTILRYLLSKVDISTSSFVCKLTVKTD